MEDSILQETIKGVPITDYLPYIYNSDDFISNVDKYTETSLNSANTLLHSCMSDDEKQCLYELMTSETGWYKKIKGVGGKKIKIIGAILGFTHLKVTDEKDKEIEGIYDSIDETQEKILGSVYVKQKIVTFKNLKNNNIDNFTLFRGVRLNGGETEYGAYSLESWSSCEDVARRFAGQTGIVLKKEFIIEDIFAYNKSIFKYNKYKDRKLSEIINREYEYIIEFNDDNCIINLK